MVRKPRETMWICLSVASLTLLVLVFGYLLFQSYHAADSSHMGARQFAIQSTLDRFPDAIVILGDSIVELSTLPRSLCGHAIVNAGIAGGSTTSDLAAVLAKSLKGKRAALIVLSIGANDAFAGLSKDTFVLNYSKLLNELSTLAAHVVVMEIPPLENDPRRAISISNYNSILPDIAKKHGAEFIALTTMPASHTMDGVHLNTAGYEIWEQSVLRGASKVCERPGAGQIDQTKR